MKFHLQHDLLFFDIEATGLNVVRDRIVQIALVKYFANGQPAAELSLLINPQMPIAEDAIAVHGITLADVANEPTFEQVAQQIFDFIGDSDLAGYNSNRFDVPLLMEEFARAGLDFEVEKRKTIDVQRIFYKMEPRTLKAAYRLYCGQELENAHDALADVRATVEVFRGQLARYDGVDLLDESGKTIGAPIKNDMQILHDFTNDLKTLDATQRLKLDSDGKTVLFNFGKYVGQPAAKILYEDRNYYHWIQNKEFSTQVKKMVKNLLEAYEATLQKKPEKEETDLASLLKGLKL